MRVFNNILISLTLVCLLNNFVLGSNIDIGSHKEELEQLLDDLTPSECNELVQNLQSNATKGPPSFNRFKQDDTPSKCFDRLQKLEKEEYRNQSSLGMLSAQISYSIK